jgi:hypothetical protein
MHPDRNHRGRLRYVALSFLGLARLRPSGSKPMA